MHQQFNIQQIASGILAIVRKDLKREFKIFKEMNDQDTEEIVKIKYGKKTRDLPYMEYTVLPATETYAWISLTSPPPL